MFSSPLRSSASFTAVATAPEQRQRNLLALFPRGMMLSCGRVEKGEFVVENTCCAQDHVLDLPRMERMERALADFAKQEANKKEN